MKRSGYTASVILAVWLLSGCGQQDDRQSAENVSEVIPETEQAAPETRQEAEAASETWEAVQEPDYGVSPLSYDVSNLAPMENKLYAAWDDKIYFRQYSDEDMEDGALWGEFEPIADTEKELMCMEPDGNIVQVGTDFGCGNMFIVNGRMYSQSYSAQIGNAEQTDWQVYSCRLDGTDKAAYQSAQTLAVCGDKVICQMNGYGELTCIDAQSGEEQVLTKGEEYCRYLAADEEQVFFYGYQINDETGTEELVLCAVDYEGNVKTLRMFPREEYKELMGEWNLYEYAMTVNQLKIAGDMLYFSAGSHNGNAYVYSGGAIYSMKRNGDDANVEAVSVDSDFYLYDDGKNRVIYYEGADEKYGGSLYGEPIAEDKCRRRVVLYGEAPQDIIPLPSYIPYDEMAVHQPTGSILFYPDRLGVCHVLLTAKECHELSIQPNVDGSREQKISDIEYIDGRLFFTVTDLTYNRDKSVGWRDYYERGKSVCYCKELENGNIRPLYEY